MKKYIKEIFYVSTGALVVFSALEYVWPGVVLAYLDYNYLLLFWLIIGIVLLLIPEKFKKNEP